MACGSSCCGPSKDPEQAVAQPLAHQPTPSKQKNNSDNCFAPDPKRDDGCKDSCCDGESESATDEKREPAPSGCQSGCCGESPTGQANTSRANSSPSRDEGQDCCAPVAAVPHSSEDCSSPAQSPKNVTNPTEPECCDGTTVPCCDDSCLDRLALRACESEKTPGLEVKESAVAYASTISLKSSECHGVEDDKPCGYHKRVTRDRYATTLAALGCICRALLALGQESCCTPKQRSSIDRKQGRRRSASRSSCKSAMSDTSSDSCCAKPGTSAAHQHHQSRKVSHARAHKHSHPLGHDHDHLHGTELPMLAKTEPHSKGPGRGGPTVKVKDCDAQSNADSCGDSCCGDDKDEGITQVSANPPSLADVEKGHTNYDHIVITVAGMTCTGCARKLERTLAALKQVRNAKATLVLSRAEFDLDPRHGGLEEVMTHLNRTSEFKCEVAKTDGFGFDATVPNTSIFTNHPWPLGVKDVTALDKTTVHIAYDPDIAKPRDLAEKGWADPLKLAPPREDPTIAANNRHVRQMGWKTLLSTMLTIPVLVMAYGPPPENKIATGSASLALATIIQVVVAGEFYEKALKSLIFSRMVEMDLLIVLSTSAAYIFSVIAFAYEVAGEPLSTGEFFETSTLLVTLIMLGRYVAGVARNKAVETISIRSLQASTATLVEADGTTRVIDTRLLQYGDIFKVAPDSAIPTDGTVIEGISEVDEAMITGESRPVEKRVKSPVIAGTINGSGTLLVRLRQLPGNNTISSIAELVDKAKAGQPRIQELADKVASYFVPVILTLSLVTFGAWVGTGIARHGKSPAQAATEAVTYAITVLIVSCPCAIGLAVPMVVVIGTGLAAKHGVIFKESRSIEIASKTSHVVFDKTGTLTEGKLSIASEEYTRKTRDAEAAMSLLLGLVKDIKHPVSVSIASYLESKGVSLSPVSDIKALPGKGVEGKSPSGDIIRAGNSRWLQLGKNEHVQRASSQSLTAFCVTINGEAVAIFGLRDTVRGDALDTVQQLQARGIQVHLVSGDDEATVSSLAAHLGIPASNVRGRCAPEDKQKYIKTLRGLDAEDHSANKTKKDKSPVVVFCGDGTNDAIALAQATIGVAIQHADDKGIGADVAKSAAHVILATPRLRGILTLINVSRKSVTRIWLNFAWSFIYNIFAILLGGGAFASYENVRIPPQFAGLGEIVSVLPVIAIAVQLRWEKV
ncbi:copper-translocating P-type ATPase [Podospora aff. communis PSN243]|uniref:Copper-translocating P-type ATPase n=1 Tax=Podospora aff. communis PSN243 TaxID=3040156 RepID=A0AAV9GL19_9PEZI|nr:copper-translocating P-type ATPase [Podospora aff. communis PSN243]